MALVDNTCHDLLTVALANYDTVEGFGKICSNKTPQKIKEDFIYIYIHENLKILTLHNFNLDASYRTDCRLTERDIFTSFLIHVAALRRCSVVKLLIIYINEGTIKIEEHLYGPKSKNTIISSERKRPFCRAEGGNAHCN